MKKFALIQGWPTIGGWGIISCEIIIRVIFEEKLVVKIMHIDEVFFFF